jgi:chromosome segregation ATPase
MSEKALKAKLGELENELASKEDEIIKYLQRIEELEEGMMNLEKLIPDDKASKQKGKKGTESKMSLDLKEKNKQIRDLKNKMGFLRKEKTQLQQELEKHTKSKSMVIRIEEKQEPLEALVKELNIKIKKQQNLIQKLKAESKKEEIDTLNAKISDLNKKLEHARSITSLLSEESSSRKVQKIQKKLQKPTKERKAKRLKRRLSKHRIKEKKHARKNGELKPSYLQKKIDDLREEVNRKNVKIKDLRKSIASLEKSQDRLATSIKGKSSEDSFTALTEELQRKLNTAKKQIKALQKQIKEYKVWKAPVEEDSQQEVINELRSKLEKITAQEPEEGQIEGREGTVNVILEDDFTLALRVRELKNLVDDLEKQNLQQRAEITALRKK